MQLYRAIFAEEECFTKFDDKDDERAFFCRTRHAIWMPCDVLEQWVCVKLVGRYAAVQRADRPKWLDEKFEARLISIFDYHKRDTGAIKAVFQEHLLCTQ